MATPRPRFVLRPYLVAVWRHRLARLVGGVIVLVLVPAGVAWSWFARQAYSHECATWDRVELSMDEVIALRQRHQAYRHDPDGGGLRLSGDELTFLLRDTFDYRVRLWFEGERTQAHVVVPAGEGCYNIDFAGSFDVVDGQVIVEPDQLVVGQADISWWVGGRSWQIDPRRFGEPRLEARLENVERFRVKDGEAVVDLRDPLRAW